jgi:predicted transcriptional regulator
VLLIEGEDIVIESDPNSIDALAKAVGKHAVNVTRTLHTMAQYGLGTLTKYGRTVIPQATADRVNVELSWGG